MRDSAGEHVPLEPEPEPRSNHPESHARPSLLDAALHYRAQGWFPIPLCWPDERGGCACGRGHAVEAVGKAPLLGSGYHRQRPDEAEIRRWWKQWPEANIGILLAPSGLVVADLDGPEAMAEARSRELPPTPVAASGRPEGGAHYYWLLPGGCPAVSAARRGSSRQIDLKADGYVVAPPSRHRSGSRYHWLSDPGLSPPQPAPDWVIEELGRGRGKRWSVARIPAALPRIDLDRLPLSDSVKRLIRQGKAADPERYRDRSCPQFAALVAMIAAALDDTTIAAVMMDPANAVGEKAREHGRRWLAGDIARARACRAAEGFESPPPLGDADAPPAYLGARPPDGWEECVTQCAGFRVEGSDPDRARARARARPRLGSEFESDDELDRERPTVRTTSRTPNSRRHLTDMGNALRLVDRHGEELRFSCSYGWLTWDGARWQRDGSGEVMRRAKETVRRIGEEAANAANPRERAGLRRWAEASQSLGRLQAMIALAESELPVASDSLDARPWLLNCANGTLYLRKGRLYSHRPEDLLTRWSPVAYDPEAECPLWEAFLERIMAGNTRLIRFLQRAVGYSLTGSTREQALFILYGTGANGKSTFLDLVAALLGDYAQQTPTQTLLARRDHVIPNDVARLKGARFVAAVEAEEGRRLAEVLVKQMTGGDTLTARFLHREYFEFKPEFKLFLATNHRPQVHGGDPALWRRIRLVPFAVTIPEDEQDRDLPERLRRELGGILAWAVRGCLEWRQDGLGTPPEVRVATEAYRAEMDTVAQFLADCCVVADEARAPAASLYHVYQQWCEANGERPMSQRGLGLRLSERGFGRQRGTAGQRTWLGLGVRAAPGQ